MEQKKSDELKFQRTRMQKESVLKTLKDKGCRITNQRKVLLDVILDEECTSCKEIYYKAVKLILTSGQLQCIEWSIFLKTLELLAEEIFIKFHATLTA